MGKSLGGQKQWTNGNTSSQIDPTTSNYLDQIMRAAQGAATKGPSPLVTGASDYYSKLMSQGNFGMGALAGDPNAVKQLMNPYQDQVIGAANKQWDMSGQNALNSSDAVATREGAFGGSRHGVMAGTAMAQNDMNRNSQVGGLLSSGFNDAMGRANTLAGYGAMGAGANANLGMGGVGSPEQWAMNMLRQGFVMPKGSTGTVNGSQTGIASESHFDVADLLRAIKNLF